jgi:(p)ppGpp synthase/HD superfamily hydrolase
MDKVQAMIYYAVRKHSGQFRKGAKDQPWKKIPYVTHCLEVMKVCSEFAISDEKVLVAAVGHDLIEDCKDVTKKELKSLFGKKVCKYILECTREEGDDANKKEKLEFLRSFSDTSAQSIAIKIADRYCNVMDYYNASGKSKYAATYALQAYPLFRAFFERHSEFERFCNPSIIEVYIDKMEKVIKEQAEYADVTLYLNGLDKKIEKLVL